MNILLSQRLIRSLRDITFQFNSKVGRRTGLHFHMKRSDIPKETKDDPLLRPIHGDSSTLSTWKMKDCTSGIGTIVDSIIISSGYSIIIPVRWLSVQITDLNFWILTYWTIKTELIMQLNVEESSSLSINMANLKMSNNWMARNLYDSNGPHILAHQEVTYLLKPGL